MGFSFWISDSFHYTAEAENGIQRIKSGNVEIGDIISRDESFLLPGVRKKYTLTPPLGTLK
jgi:hypothetical protein